LRTILKIGREMTPLTTSTGLRLCDLARGSQGIVTAVEAEGTTVERLAALGLVPGTAFRVVSHGSPMTVALGESRFALGRTYAEAVRVIAV
jgi:Fe2+ transport system protein FeoA